MSEERASGYEVKSTSKMSAEVEEVDLGIGETGTTRRVLRAEIVKNPHDGNKSVRATIIHQRRAGPAEKWVDLGGPGLNKLKANEAAKIELDSDQTHQLFQHLSNLYQIGAAGIKPGKGVLVVANEDDVIQAATSRARIIRKLLEANRGEEFWKALEGAAPNLATSLAMARLYHERKKVVNQFEADLAKELGEEYWQELLATNRWIFGNSYIGRIGERRINIKSALDHPLIAEDGCLEIIEIKKPEFPFWKLTKDGKTSLYRGKYALPHAELEGAVSQASGYVFETEKVVDSIQWQKDHDGIRPIKPRAVVVHGRSIGWSDVEQEAFRLLNDRHHGITIITFDHLLVRAKQVLDYFNPDSNTSNHGPESQHVGVTK